MREALESHAYYKEVGVSQATLIGRHLDTDLVKANRDLQMRMTRIITSHSFRTHNDTIKWRSAKKRFKDINGQNVLVPGPPLHGYVPEPVVPSIPSEMVSVGSELLPWLNPALVRVFQPFQSD